MKTVLYHLFGAVCFLFLAWLGFALCLMVPNFSREASVWINSATLLGKILTLALAGISLFLSGAWLINPPKDIWK